MALESGESMDSGADESLDNESLDTASGEDSSESFDELSDDDESWKENLEDSEEKPELKEKAEPKPAAKKDEKIAAEKKAAREIAEDELDSIVTVKIDGVTKKVTLRELQKSYGLEAASHERIREAAEGRKKVTQLAELAKRNPDKFFELAGVDQETIDKITEERLVKRYEREAMTDEERELADYRDRANQQKEMESQTKQAVLQAIEDEFGEKVPDNVKGLPKERLEQILNQVKQQNQKMQIDLDTDIGNAWKDSGLPKHPRFVQLMAQDMRNELHRTGKALPAKEAAARVKESFLKDVSGIAESMTGDELNKLLGETTMKKLRAFFVERVRGKSQASTTEQPAPGPAREVSQRNKPVQKEMSPWEYREHMAKLKNSLRD